MRKSSIFGAIIFIMSLFIAFLIYANNELDKQVGERDDIIRKMQERESIIDSLIVPVQKDTTSFIYFFRDEQGKIISYGQLDSLCHHYQRQIDMMDFIILTAKKKFNFDYSIKQNSDMMTLKIWDKKYTIIKELE
jgi:hypothetical protein